MVHRALLIWKRINGGKTLTWTQKYGLNVVWSYFPIEQTKYQVDVTLHHVIAQEYTISLCWQWALMKPWSSFGSSEQTKITPLSCHCQTRPFLTHINTIFWCRIPAQFNFYIILFRIRIFSLLIKIIGGEYTWICNPIVLQTVLWENFSVVSFYFLLRLSRQLLWRVSYNLSS